jgi:hypothetical protein
MGLNPQRARNRSHATWVGYVFWAFVLLAVCAVCGPLLLGCTAAPEPGASRRPATSRTATQEPPPAVSATTRELCDALVQNYYADRLPRVDTKAALVAAAKEPGVAGPVRDAVLNVLYPNGTLPTEDNVVPRYDVVLQACRDAGWAG